MEELETALHKTYISSLSFSREEKTAHHTHTHNLVRRTTDTHPHTRTTSFLRVRGVKELRAEGGQRTIVTKQIGHYRALGISEVGPKITLKDHTTAQLIAILKDMMERAVPILAARAVRLAEFDGDEEDGGDEGGPYESPAEWDSDDEQLMACCAEKYVNGEECVFCDSKCGEWRHIVCEGISFALAKRAGRYVCSECRSKLSPGS
jgi:hypothetical protein